jgi:hypothetical protein
MSFFFKRTPKPSQGVVEELLAGLEDLQVSKLVTVGHVRGCGGFADVYDGWMKVKGSKQKKKVAVKRFRVILNKEEEAVKV